MPKVSIYPRISEIKQGAEVELSDVLNWIREGEWKDRIDKIHEAVKNGVAEKELAKLKTDLCPYFTGAGTFSIRNEQGLIQHSGKLIIDFDKLKDLPAAKEILCCDKYSEAVFLSCTGRGLAVIVNIDPGKHLESFEHLKKYYKDTYGLSVDKSCKDLSRPRFISYDPELFTNDKPEFVRLPSATIDGDAEKYDWIVGLHNKYEAFVEGNRHNYLQILLLRLNTYGVDSEYALNKVLADFICPDKTEKEIRSMHKWAYDKTDSFGTRTINKAFKELPPEEANKIRQVAAYAHTINQAGRNWTDEDILQMCQTHLIGIDMVRGIFQNVFEKHKDEFDLDQKPEVYKLKLFLNKSFDFRRNIILHRIEFKKKQDTEYKYINLSTINVMLMEAGFKFSPEKTKTIIYSDYVQEYDPFRNYFDNLPKWSEGDEDHISKLAACVTTDDQEFWMIQFKKALVRTVACAIEGIENRIVMTLSGQLQGTGKSTFIRFLCPPQLNEYVTEEYMVPGRDSSMQLAENFIWLLDELNQMPYQDLNRLKAAISSTKIKQRRAYAEFHETNQRRVSFWATTNEDDFLLDSSNTRWLCFKVLGQIDKLYFNKNTGIGTVDINMVWAQAYELFNIGFIYKLTKEESDKQQAINTKYERGSTERDLILKYFKKATLQNGEFMSNVDILFFLQEKIKDKAKLNSFYIGKALRQLSFVDDRRYINGHQVRGWLVLIPPLMPGDNTVQYSRLPDEPPF